MSHDSIVLLVGAAFVLVGLVGYLRSKWIELSVPAKLMRALAMVLGTALMVWSLVPAGGPNLHVGSIMLWSGSADAIPSGWLLCNGQRISRAKYPELHQVIGGTYDKGGDSGEFALPDLSRRFPIGAAGAIPGAPGGSPTLPPLPAHTHPLAGLSGEISNRGEDSGTAYHTRDDHEGWSAGVHFRVDGGSSTQEGQHRHELQGDAGPSDSSAQPPQPYLPPYLELHFIIKSK